MRTKEENYEVITVYGCQCLRYTGLVEDSPGRKKEKDLIRLSKRK